MDRGDARTPDGVVSSESETVYDAEKTSVSNTVYEDIDSIISLDERTEAADSTQTTLSPATSQSEDETQDLIRRAGGFELRRVIGIGGLGEVWEAVQPTLGRVVAIKRIRESIYRSQKQDLVERLKRLFQHEALVTGIIEHPNIVPVHDLAFDEQGRPILLMKLVRGQPWDIMLEEDNELPPLDLLGKHLPILIDMAQAVAFAHSKGIVHRDLKPAQVMVGQFGEVLLMDWGLALVYDKEKALAAAPDFSSYSFIVTRENAHNPAGSPGFMAPEQTENTTANVGPWTDVFLLGATLYRLLTHTVPHKNTSANDFLQAAALCEIEPPELRAPERDVPAELSALCMRAMAKHPGDRIGSVTEFIAVVQDYLSGASKRRQSQKLTEDVSVRIACAGGNYRELSECDNLVGAALGLWAENPEARRLRQQVLSKFAETAIDNNDLILARVQAERLEDCEARTELLNEISVLEKLSERESLEAEEAERILLASEESRRRSAELARRTEELINTLLQQLHGQLGVSSETAPLHEVARKTIDFFESLFGEDSSEESLRERADTYCNLADLLEARGEPGAALEAYRESLAMLEALAARLPANADRQARLRTVQTKIAKLLATVHERIHRQAP